MNQTTIGILGLGAIGSVIARSLQGREGVQLHYYNRSPRQALKIRMRGREFNIPIFCQTTPDTTPALDWLIICLKEHHFAEAKNWLEKLISPSTKVVVIRNGLRLKEAILPYSKEGNILEGMIDCPTQLGGDGFYEQLQIPKLMLPQGELATEFAELFDPDQVRIQLSADFKTDNWKKVCESSALGAMLCLSGETCWIFQDPKVQKLYTSILTEAVAVAKVDGAKIEDSFVSEMLDKVLAYPPTKGSSMLTDRLNGQPIELGAKNGVISEIGKVYGVATPLNDMICVLLGGTNRF